MPLFQGLWSENTTAWGADQDMWSSAFTTEILQAIAQRGGKVRFKNKQWEQLKKDQRAKMFFKEAELSEDPLLKEITYDIDKILELLGFGSTTEVTRKNLRERIKERYTEWLLIEARRNKIRYAKREPYKFKGNTVIKKGNRKGYGF
jgi:hypothetical protein